MPNTTRRKFLQSSAAAASASTVFSPFAIGKPGESPNSKINMAVVGCGGMGGYAVSEAAKQNLVAMCDLDLNRTNRSVKKHAAKLEQLLEDLVEVSERCIAEAERADQS